MNNRFYQIKCLAQLVVSVAAVGVGIVAAFAVASGSFGPWLELLVK